jgi:sphinganine-1-phosphate aldolase
MSEFPQQGQDEEGIFSALMSMREDDLKENGRAYAFSYDAGEDVKRVAQRAFAACMGGNGLDPTAYPSARRLENALVATTLAHLRAPEGAVGSCTSGGTESVMLSVKAARDYARKVKPHIKQPEMLVPETAHASFHKAAHYFGVTLVLVDVDPESMRASIDDYRAKLSGNTVLIVASAPSYAHGVVDPIVECGQLALKADVLLHVDACIGGWVLPLQRELGLDVPEFDFNVPGVTSISVDLHKYAFAPKGVSVILHRTPEVRACQYYACATWSGYTVVNPTMLGSKSMAAMGAAWAVIRYLGKEGYLSRMGDMAKAKDTLVNAVDGIDGLRVLGRPDMGLVAVGTDGLDVFVLADRLIARGWQVQPTYAFANSPAHIHFSINPASAVNMDAFVADLKESAVDLPATIEVPPMMIQMLQAVTSGQGGLKVGAMMGEMGITDGQLPKEQAMIHRLVNAAPTEVRESLLTAFMGDLFS